MRVAVWHNLPSGGGKRALWLHVRGLLERGHAVEAWCPPSADQYFLPLGKLVEEHVVPLDKTVRQPRTRLQQVLYPVNWIRTMTAAHERHCRQVAAEIEQGGFDLVLAASCRHLRVPAIGRHLPSLPTVLYLQEPYRPLYEALPQLPWPALAEPRSAREMPRYWRRRIWDGVAVRAARLRAREELANVTAFDRVLVSSRFSRESLLRAFGIEARVCYLGVDTDVFFDEQAEREDLLIGLGAIVPAKNLELVVDAVARLDEPRPKLVWVGDSSQEPYRRTVEERAVGAGVDLELRIGVDDAVLRGLLNRATALVYGPRLEPFGLAPLEANACATPVVAVAEGGVRETVVDGVNGLLVGGGAEALAAAIQRLRNDPGLARHLGCGGLDLVGQLWSADAAVERLEASLDETLAGFARKAAPGSEGAVTVRVRVAEAVPAPRRRATGSNGSLTLRLADFRLSSRGRRRLENAGWGQRPSVALFGRPFLTGEPSEFLVVYRSIFEREIYRFETDEKRPLIYDCGANIGVSVLYFKALHPQAEIVAYEPDPDLFATLERNVSTYRLTDVSLRCEAVWNSSGETAFLSESGVGGRIVAEGETSCLRRVRTVRLRDELASAPRAIDLVKLDIEGAELAALTDCGDGLARVRRLFVEYHGQRDAEQTLPELLGLLTGAGFRYTLEREGSVDHPFVAAECSANSVFDLQVNIFATRPAGAPR